MKLSKTVSAMSPKRQRFFCCKPLPALALLCAAVFIGTAFVVTDERILALDRLDVFLGKRFRNCKGICRPTGSEALPRGIVSRTSNLEMRPLWGATKKRSNTMNLLAMAVGSKQKKSVDKIVNKFMSSGFSVMLFHYDGNVDDWRNFEWFRRALHVATSNQTKWWFAKRFLHPDIVSEYSYIFLWDEDLGVENFKVERYLSVIKKERLDISQPALDSDKSEMGALVHRNINKVLPGPRKCDENSTETPCTGLVEMVAPVFSRAVWRCVWYVIQNDLVQTWDVDFRISYCTQGKRTKSIGIIDSDYVVHYDLPTLGSTAGNKTDTEGTSQGARGSSSGHLLRVRKQSLTDLDRFKHRWKRAVKE